MRSAISTSAQNAAPCARARSRSACPTCGTVPEALQALSRDRGGGGHGHAWATCDHGISSIAKRRCASCSTVSTKRSLGDPAGPGPAFAQRADRPPGRYRRGVSRARVAAARDRPARAAAGAPAAPRCAAAYRSQPMAAILASFHATRRQTINLLRGLTSAAWHRHGHHELYGEIDLLHQGNWVVAHERAHLVEMIQVRHDLLVLSQAAKVSPDLGEVVVTNVSEGE
ncbi:MAG: DinB family protein [Kouleothrix sp.]